MLFGMLQTSSSQMEQLTFTERLKRLCNVVHALFETAAIHHDPFICACAGLVWSVRRTIADFILDICSDISVHPNRHSLLSADAVQLLSPVLAITLLFTCAELADSPTQLAGNSKSDSL
jgi:hypothetical protein